MTDLNIAGIRRLAKKGGAERISRDALEYLLYVIEKLTIEISKQAKTFAELNDRKTINIREIKHALKKLGLLEIIEGKNN